MEKFWNFLFYATWILLRDLSNKLINKPIQRLAILLYPKKKHKKSFENYQDYLKKEKKIELKPRYSSNVSHAFNFMLMTTGFILITFFTVLISVVFPELKQGLYLGLFLGLVGSIFINFYFLYSNDKYLHYFKSYNEQPNLSTVYLTAILLHLIPFVLLITLILKN